MKQSEPFEDVHVPSCRGRCDPVSAAVTRRRRRPVRRPVALRVHDLWLVAGHDHRSQLQPAEWRDGVSLGDRQAEQLPLRSAFRSHGGGLRAQGNWELFTDLVYADIGSLSSKVRTLHTPGGEIHPQVDINVDVDMKATIWTLGAGYTAARNNQGNLDIIGGARYAGIESIAGRQRVRPQRQPRDFREHHRQGESVDRHHRRRRRAAPQRRRQVVHAL